MSIAIHFLLNGSLLASTWGSSTYTVVPWRISFSWSEFPPSCDVICGRLGSVIVSEIDAAWAEDATTPPPFKVIPPGNTGEVITIEICARYPGALADRVAACATGSSLLEVELSSTNTSTAIAITATVNATSRLRPAGSFAASPPPEGSGMFGGGTEVLTNPPSTHRTRNLIGAQPL